MPHLHIITVFFFCCITIGEHERGKERKVHCRGQELLVRYRMEVYLIFCSVKFRSMCGIPITISCKELFAIMLWMNSARHMHVCWNGKYLWNKLIKWYKHKLIKPSHRITQKSKCGGWNCALFTRTYLPCPLATYKRMWISYMLTIALRLCWRIRTKDVDTFRLLFLQFGINIFLQRKHFKSIL